MKKVYKIYSFEKKEMCVPSNDYYARSGDWYTSDTEYLEPYSDEFDTMEEAEKALESYPKDRVYTILSIYSFEK